MAQNLERPFSFKRTLKAFISNNYQYTPTEILRKSLLIFNIICKLS